jgi:hypothetical protein
MNYLWLLWIILSIYFLTTWEKREVLKYEDNKKWLRITLILNPVIWWAILYFWLKKKHPDFAKKVNQLSWRIFWVYILLYFVYMYSQLK